MPIIVVAFAYTIAQGLIYFYAKSGATVSDNSTSIFVVLMFGVGTDYCLLLVSRYREELRRWEDKHDAMAHALAPVRAGDPGERPDGRGVDAGAAARRERWRHVARPGRGDRRGVRAGRRPHAAAGDAGDRRPARRSGRASTWSRSTRSTRSRSAAGWWRRFGDRVLQRPGLALAATLLMFAIGALGLLAYKEDYSTTTFFKKPTESVDGFKVLERALPAGSLAPTTVLVEREDGPVRPADVAAARRLAAGQAGRRGRDAGPGSLARRSHRPLRRRLQGRPVQRRNARQDPGHCATPGPVCGPASTRSWAVGRRSSTTIAHASRDDTESSCRSRSC